MCWFIYKDWIIRRHPSTYTNWTNSRDHPITIGPCPTSGRKSNYLFAAFKQLIADTDAFVDSAYEEVARLSPLKAQSDASPPGGADNESLEAWFGIALEDIGILRGQLDDIETQILATRIMIKDQLDLRTGRRTGLIGLLAVIYIPFAFMSSLFGMNVKDPVWGPVIPRTFQPETLDNMTAQANTSTAIALNQKDTITSAISMSGGYLWSFKMYWIIAAPVTFATILLPLVAGPTIRYIVEFFYHNRAYSRIALSLLGVAGEVLAAVFLPFLAYLIVFGVAYGTLALGILSQSSLSARNQLLWASFAAVFAYSLLLDLDVDLEKFDYIPITGFIPLEPYVFWPRI
ncbi:MAG: hypothetical protein Q9207_002508 [Kuettlingeria erythrocarpa]